MTSRPVPRIFDLPRHARRLDRAAPRFAEYDFLKSRLSRALTERLADSARRFPTALDLCSHDGTLGRALVRAGQVDDVTCCDFSPRMIARALTAGAANGSVMNGEQLDFEPGRFDLVASTFALHWINDLPGLMVQVRNTLRPDGLLLAALAGAGTLRELRESLIEAETEIRGGAAPRISPLPGLQDTAGLLQRAGFAMPVADSETVTVRYGSPLRLLDDLRGMGETAAFAQGGAGGLSRRVLARMAQVYAERFSDPDGKVRASFEIIWLSGWAPAPGQPRPLRPGSAKARLADAVGARERSAGEAAGARPQGFDSSPDRE